MPVLEFTIDPGSITASMLPIRYQLGPIGPFGFGGTAPIPISIGSGPFDFGIKVNYICMGYPTCGKTGEPCKLSIATPVLHFSPFSLLSTKIPGIPALPSGLGPFGFSLVVPPKPFRPFNCPNYRSRRPKT